MNRQWNQHFKSSCKLNIVGVNSCSCRFIQSTYIIALFPFFSSLIFYCSTSKNFDCSFSLIEHTCMQNIVSSTMHFTCMDFTARAIHLPSGCCRTFFSPGVLFLFQHSEHIVIAICNSLLVVITMNMRFLPRNWKMVGANVFRMNIRSKIFAKSNR